MSVEAEPQGLARSIEQSIRRGDYLRRSPFHLGGAGSHKEWMHFVVNAPGIELLANWSLVDDVSPTAKPGTEFARLVVLTRDREWDGGIKLYDNNDVTVRGGGIEMHYGESSVVFSDGVYRLQVRLPERRIEADLELRPLCMPALSNNIRLALDERPIQWMVLPRLSAHGHIRIADREYNLDGATAYHDHNWGHFRWGRDFAWEWGFAQPTDHENPWTVVFVRLSDRARGRSYKQGLFLWNGASQERVFRAQDMQIESHGFLRMPKVFKLPSIMNVIQPGTAADVPGRLEIRAEDGPDRLTVMVENHDVAQVCIPNDDGERGTTIINEVSGALTVRGRVHGHEIEMEGPSMFEFIRHA